MNAMMDSARAVFLLAGLVASVTAAPRPNIIVVVADEYVHPSQSVGSCAHLGHPRLTSPPFPVCNPATCRSFGWNDISLRNPNVSTPHMDAMAREGILLDRHYVFKVSSFATAAVSSGSDR